MELESALIDDCTVNDIYAICRGKSIPENLRDAVWQVCLDTKNKGDQLQHFNEIYDLPFQNQLRQDCQNFVSKLGNDEEDKVSVMSDLESILTFYCKNRNFKYESNNGWIELLLPVLNLKLKRSETYNLFETIRDTYIPKGNLKRGNVYHIFRLLILYHDPELCAILDTKRITPDQYAQCWFSSLFAASCTLKVVLKIWDLYFQQTDPFLVFFLSLIMLVNRRDTILEMRNESKEAIASFLANMPCELDADDVNDFCSLAQYYSSRTPSSFKTELLNSLFGQQTEVEEPTVVSQALCLPVSVYELVETAAMENPPEGAVKFFLVDCRPHEQYNAGHLSTAFHLDCNLMLQEPAEFQTAVQGLLRSQKSAIDANSNAGGEHLCFMGSGRVDEDQYTHMVVASFLQKGTQYVSILTGGFTAIHNYFGDPMLDCLEDHDVLRCLVCNKDGAVSLPASNNNSLSRKSKSKGPTPSTSSSSLSQQSKSFDFFGKISSAMKSKTSEVKGKLFEYIVNPSPTTPEVVEKHVAISEKNSSKRYRNVAPVFGIDEDETPPDTGDLGDDHTDGDSKELVTIQTYIKNADVIKSFKCQEVHLNGAMFDSYLIVNAEFIVVLRETDKRGQAQVIAKRPLHTIVKITAKKRHRDLITFKYGVPGKRR